MWKLRPNHQEGEEVVGLRAAAAAFVGVAAVGAAEGLWGLPYSKDRYS